MRLKSALVGRFYKQNQVEPLSLRLRCVVLGVHRLLILANVRPLYYNT